MKKLTIIISVLTAGLYSCGGGNENKKTANGTSSTDATQSAKNLTATEIPSDVSILLERYACFNCHKPDEKLIGPAYKDIALKGYKDEEIVNLIYNPKPENWPGYPPMLPQKEVPQADAMKIAGWINSLK